MTRTTSRIPILTAVLCGASLAAAQTGELSSPSLPGPVTDPSATFAWADYDQDGLVDAAAVQADGSLSLLKNLGDGSFADVTTSVGVDARSVSFVLFEDGNGDGLPDLFVASRASGDSQLLLNRAGTFQSTTVGSGLESLGGVLTAQWLDYDADGLLDLHVTSPAANTLFHALGIARFEPIELPVAQPGQASAFTTAALGLLTEGTDEQGAAVLQNTVVDVDATTTIVAGGGSRTPVGGPAGTGGGTQNMGTIVPGWPQCTRRITDDATGACIAASSTPTLGMLYPLSTDLFVDAASGRVGLGTTTPSQSLQIGEFTTPQDALIELRSGLGGGVLEQGMRLRSEGGGIGFDVLHDDALGGLHVVNYDFFAGAFGDSALFVDRQTGNVAFGSTDAEHPLTVDAINNGIVQRGDGIHVGTYAGLGAGWYGTYTSHPLSFFVASGAEAMTIDTNEFVGIGTATPTRPLDVVTDANVSTVVSIQNTDPLGFSGLEIRDDQGSPRLSLRHSNNDAETFVECESNSLTFLVEGASAMGLSASSCTISGSTTIGGNAFVAGDQLVIGSVGIGTVAPAHLLSVNGSAGKPGGGSWSNFSDRRLKKNVEDLDGALDTLLALRGVTFEYKDPEAIHELAGERIGFIAQEVETVLPDWVEDAGEYKMLTIRGFEALAVEALRELQAEKDAEIEALRAEVERLQGMTERVAALESALSEVLATR